MCHRTIASHDPLINRSRLTSGQPLSDSAGNIRCPPVLESNGSFHDTKGSLPMLDKKTSCAGRDQPCVNCEVEYGASCIYQNQSQGLGYDLGYGIGMENGGCGAGVEQAPQFITLPSQRSGRKRRKAGRRRRRNPIADSSQYQVYRSRQTKDAGDAKWSDVLEDLFLDALMDIPVMGRRKFSFNSTPHGRNELISEYLWIGYKRSLPKGVAPDETMKRTRKQVSSHIQVLKGFMKDSPSYSLIFPSKVAAANGSEDSFRDNTTLKALAEGRLPPDDYDHDDRDENSPPLLKPASFEMFVSASESKYHEYHGSNRIHDYSSLSSPPLNGSRQSIDTIRSKFPGELAKLEATNSLPPCIIYMNVGISLMEERPNGAELNTRVFLNIINPPSSQMRWRTLTTLSKPKILCGDPDIDLHIYKKVDEADSLTEDDGTMKLQPAFPALPWAHAFIALIDLHDDSLLERITMYQEISSSTNNQPFIRRALLLWTFHKSHDLNGETTWRYITPNPPPSPPSRHEVFSPGIDELQPYNHHSIHSVLQDNFSSTWGDTSHLIPQNHIPQDLIDPFVSSYNDTHLSQSLPHSHSQAPSLRSPINLNFNSISVHSVPHFPYYQHDTTSHLPDNVSMSQESDSTTLSTHTLVNFDTHHGLDIHLSYDGVGVGVLDLDGFGDGNAWLETPTRGDGGGVGVGVGVSVDHEGFGGEGLNVGEAWGYDEQGGIDVGHLEWGDEQGDLGVGHFGGHQIQGGNISVGTN